MLAAEDISTGLYIIGLILTLGGVGFAAITAPLLLQRSSDKRREKERAEDKADREEAKMVALEAAAKVAEAAETLKDNSATIAASAAQATVDQAAQAQALQNAQAEQAAEAQSQAADAAALLLESNKKADDQATKQMGMLEGIHTLVNSSLTKAMESELGATQRELAMMKEVIELKSSAGLTPTPEAIEAIATTSAKITELKIVIGERLEKTKIAEQQIDEKK